MGFDVFLQNCHSSHAGQNHPGQSTMPFFPLQMVSHLHSGKIFDEDNKNTLFNLDCVPYCQNKNILNEESEISSILGEKEKYNIDDLSIANGEFNNFSSGNGFYLKLISNEFNNNNFYSSEFKFNFENPFLKDNFN